MRDLAQALGLDAEFCDPIHYASPMHDVGKIAIPDVILLKPGGFEPHDGRTLPSHFDPAVLAAFKGCTANFRDIFEAHTDEA